jgi:hypothetical protein
MQSRKGLGFSRRVSMDARLAEESEDDTMFVFVDTPTTDFVVDDTQPSSSRPPQPPSSSSRRKEPTPPARLAPIFTRGRGSKAPSENKGLGRKKRTRSIIVESSSSSDDDRMAASSKAQSSDPLQRKAEVVIRDVTTETPNDSRQSDKGSPVAATALPVGVTRTEDGLLALGADFYESGDEEELVESEGEDGSEAEGEEPRCESVEEAAAAEHVRRLIESAGPLFEQRSRVRLPHVAPTGTTEVG